jgi:protease I
MAGSLSGKTCAILVEDLYQDQEVWYPLFRLREEGAKVVAVGTGKRIYKSKHGYEITADADIKEVAPGNFDCVVIPGGYAPDILRRFPEVNKFVADMNQQGGVVAAICHGPWVLCSANVLRGKTMTCFFAIKDDCVNAGAKYVDQEVVVDGNLVTARKPEDLPAFMREIVKLLKAQ